MTQTLRVAAGQAPAVCGDVARNVATAVALTREAGERGVRLLALPEAFVTNYCPEQFVAPPTVEALPQLLAPLVAAATDAGTTVVVSAPVGRGDVRTLSSVVVDADGSVRVPYDKQHLSGDVERDHFAAGECGASVTVDGWEIALSICYDGSFPEHARAAADDGARLYVNSGAFFVGGEHRRDTYYPARALDNGIFVLFAGATGGCDHASTTFAGGSAAYDPEGRALARLGRETGLAVADLDPAVVAMTRAAHPMHADRLVDLGVRRRA